MCYCTTHKNNSRPSGLPSQCFDLYRLAKGLCFTNQPSTSVGPATLFPLEDFFSTECGALRTKWGPSLPSPTRQQQKCSASSTKDTQTSSEYICAGVDKLCFCCYCADSFSTSSIRQRRRGETKAGYVEGGEAVNCAAGVA